MKLYIVLGYITLVLFFSSRASYSFDLFDPDRGKPPPPTPKVTTPLSTANKKSPPNPFVQARKLPPPRPQLKKKEPPPPPQRDFVLRGTSRIGDKRVVVLTGFDNKEFIQRLENNQRTPIAGYPDYYLLSVEPREIRIEYPTESPCRQDNPQKGLKCNKADEGKTAILSLKQGKALPPPPPPKPQNTTQSARSSGLSKEEQAKKRKEERERRQKLYKNFKRQVIKDEDVPPGMRVVRTPFGDRLVPIK